MGTSSRSRRSELQRSVPQQCSRVVHVGQGNCFFPVNEEEKEEEEEEQEENKYQE